MSSAPSYVRIDIDARPPSQTLTRVQPLAEPAWSLAVDIETGLPFRDGTVDELWLTHVLEKVGDVHVFLRELWRVSKEGALVHVVVPHFTSGFTTWLEMTRRRAFSLDAFHRLGRVRGAAFDVEVAEIRFTAEREEGSVHPVRQVLGRFVEPFANRSRNAQYRCERWWGSWVGFDELYVIMRAVKDPRELGRRHLPEGTAPRVSVTTR